MQDIKNDFYKRHGRDGGIADSFFCPASVCIFRCETAEVGLSLSFGAHTAYRRRSDGRIILSRTDSNIKESVNQIDIDRFKGAAWAEEIINALKKLPSTEYGAEILMHTDVGEPSLAPQLLCAVSAFSKLCENSISPQNLISLSGCPPYQLASLANSRIAAANTATLDYMTYNPTADGKKIIVIKTGKKHKPTKLPKSFYDRELSRINSLSGSFTSIGELMFEASRDMLSYISASDIKALFEYMSEFCNSFRILSDLSGAVLILSDRDVDEFIKLFSDRYEKKTGTCPAFYISD